MSDKKITLKVTVKPNGDNGWRTVCNAYPQIVGEGRDCEAALSSLVEKIREEFKEGTFKLDSQLIPAVSCQITEMKANLVLGTENYTLADFGTEAEADAEAEGEKDSADTPKVPEITSAGGCDTCKKYAEGDCGGTAAGDACKEYKPFRYLWERCENCQFSPDEHTHCTVYDAATYPDHYACTSFRLAVIQNEEADTAAAAGTTDKCESCEKDCSCSECIEAGEDNCTTDAFYQKSDFPGVDKTPCDNCKKHMKECGGNNEDKEGCKRYPMCSICGNCISTQYKGEQKDGKDVLWKINCKIKGESYETTNQVMECLEYNYKSLDAEPEAAQTAEEAA